MYTPRMLWGCCCGICCCSIVCILCPAQACNVHIALGCSAMLFSNRCAKWDLLLCCGGTADCSGMKHLAGAACTCCEHARAQEQPDMHSIKVAE
jgi:hypothetical protein